jgi:hypothetical protein
MEKVVWIHLLYNPPHVAKQLSLDLFEKVYWIVPSIDIPQNSRHNLH